MSLYRAVVVFDDTVFMHRVHVRYDDNDPHAIIAISPPFLRPEDKKAVDAAINSVGFRVVGGKGLPRGERIVTRKSPHRWFNPKTREWHSTKPKA